MHFKRIALALSFCLLATVVWAGPTVGNVTVTPSAIAVGQATTVTVTVQITDPTVIAASVNLQRLDAAGKVTAVLGSLRDDGTGGDAVALDSIFTRRFLFNEPAAGQIRLRASAGFKGVLQRVFSQVMSLQAVAADAVGEIGPDGGVLQVTDTASALVGVCVTVPAGTVASKTLFTVAAGPLPSVSLPSWVEPDGPAIMLNASSPLLAPVIIEIPFHGQRVEGELRLLFHFDEGALQWNAVQPTPGESPERMRAQLSHFSTYVKAKQRITATSVITGFSLSDDALSADNTIAPGICLGMSLLAQDYFINQASSLGESLMCRWDSGDAWLAGSEAHQVVNSEVNRMDGLALVSLAAWADQSFIVDFTIASLALNRPVTIGLVHLTDTRWHAVLVTGWERTGPFTGRFRVYDNQDHNAGNQVMHYWTVDPALPLGITRMSYTSCNGDDYIFFAFPSLGLVSFDQVYAHYPPSQGTCAAKAGIVTAYNLAGDWFAWVGHPDQIRVMPTSPTRFTARYFNAYDDNIFDGEIQADRVIVTTRFASGRWYGTYTFPSVSQSQLSGTLISYNGGPSAVTWTKVRALDGKHPAVTAFQLAGTWTAEGDLGQTIQITGVDQTRFAGSFTDIGFIVDGRIVGDSIDVHVYYPSLNIRGVYNFTSISPTELSGTYVWGYGAGSPPSGGPSAVRWRKR